MRLGSICPGCLFTILLFLFLLPISVSLSLSLRNCRKKISFLSLLIQRLHALRRFDVSFSVFFAIFCLRLDARSRSHKNYRHCFAWCLIQIFSFSLQIHLSPSSPHIWLLLVASRGRETKSKWACCGMSIECLLKCSVVLPLILCVAFLMTNAVFPCSLPSNLKYNQLECRLRSISNRRDQSREEDSQTASSHPLSSRRCEFYQK